MEYAKKADASGRYNRAFERYRSQWLRDHLTQLIVGLVLIIVGVKLLKWVVRRQKKKKTATAESGTDT